MKKHLLRLLAPICLFLFLYSASSGQTAARPTYPLKFRFTNSAGIQRDTVLTRQGYKYWSKSPSYGYSKWKDLPFAVLKSHISGIGLFTDSVSSFNTGDTIGWAYFKIASTSRFDLSYYQTNLGSFINDDTGSPNATVVSTPKGLVLIANQRIQSLTEIVISYQSILDMFPGDPSVVRAIQYW